MQYFKKVSYDLLRIILLIYSKYAVKEVDMYFIYGFCEGNEYQAAENISEDTLNVEDQIDVCSVWCTDV